MRKLLTVFASVALLMSLTSGAVAAAKEHGGNAANKPKIDNLPSPQADKQAALRESALGKVLKGQATPKGANQVVKLAKGQFVELARQGEDAIWTTLGEFGNTIVQPQGGDPGPLHNVIPEPDRNFDNSTIWEPDFSESYYEDLLFDDVAGQVSMRNFYKEQSSNRYTVHGNVEDWVLVPYNEARYGTNLCGSIVCSTVWRFVNDSIDGWYAAKVADGWTAQDFADYLAPYDVWDRYDWDGDGNFNEPDGYIDHYQAIHAGEGEETGGGAQGANAIWSHRWYAWYSANGPDGTGSHGLGGTRIGNTNFWVGDYTVEPENGGVGVFSHEFGHDLGLPDLYDTSGNVGGAENSTGFWTLYSSGSYGNTGIASEGIGSKPIPMSVYEKLLLGWSNYALFGYGQSGAAKLSAASLSTKQNQSLVALLPDKDVTFTIGDPYAGSYFYHSGAGDNLDNTMTREITLGAGPINLSFQGRWHIEACWDYAYLQVSTDGGGTWTNIHTSASTADDTYGQNFGEGITGTSGTPLNCDEFGTPVWVPVTADLSAYANSTIQIRFRYWTDGATTGQGFGFDDLAITGLATDGAETDPGWTYAGFSRTTGSTTVAFFNAYFAEYRAYFGYDDGLRTGPYNFGFTGDYANWVEHFPYQDGLLIWYYDTSFSDNNVGAHCAAGRCGGIDLPVDAHPGLLLRNDGTVWRPRVQSYDSTFGKQATDAVCLHRGGVAQTCFPSLPAVSTFNDNNSYWVAPNPATGNLGWSSVQVPHTGTVIKVSGTSAGSNFMQVLVNP